MRAKEYIFKNITNIFPEICTGLQNKRASYYILKNQLEFMEYIKESGKISESEALQFIKIISTRLFKLHFSSPTCV